MKRKRTQQTGGVRKKRRTVAPTSRSRVSLTKSIELKAFDIAATTYDVNTTGSFTLLNVPVLGTDYTNRIGRKLIVKSLYIRGYVQPQVAYSAPVTTSAAGGIYRFIIFVDNQPNGTTPGVTDLLTAAEPSAQLNLNNRDRFRVIKDKIFTHGPITSVTTATQAQLAFDNVTKSVKIYKKLNVETIFTGVNGGTIADINTGALYMFWIGETVSSVNDGQARLTTRIRFLDN